MGLVGGEALGSRGAGIGMTGNGWGGNDKGTLLSTMLFLLAALVLGLGLRELPMGLTMPLALLLPTVAAVSAGAMTDTREAGTRSSSGDEEEEARMVAALSRTEGTLR